MEDKFLIDLSIKYGLDSSQLSKIADIMYQCGYASFKNKEAQQICEFLCTEKMVDKPAEEVMEELKLKGFIAE